MGSYTHFTLSERKYLQQLLSEGKSFREIAAILERSPSTISREVKRNSAKYKPKHKPDNPYWYNHWRAQNLYIRRRRVRQRFALKPGSPAWQFIIDRLKVHWSPEMICERWNLLHSSSEHQRLSISTLYRYIKELKLPNITPKTHLRRRGKRLCTRNANYNSIQPERIIPQWDDIIKQRLRIGDWEGDTVYGAVGKGLLVTLVDRRSRFLCSARISSRSASETREAIVHCLKDLPVYSISLDNGSEFSEFHILQDQLSTDVYFAEPHKPWQRGTNENTNDILRYYFPKGYNFHELSDDDLQQVVREINNKPRKCLGWKTPAEVISECLGVALA